MSEKRRTHPLTLIVIIFSVIKSQAFYLGILFLISGRENPMIYFSVVGGLLLLICIISWIRWLRFTYYITEDELRIEYGLLVRKHTFISKNRIQSIDLTQGLVHRLFGLAELSVETASTSGDSVSSLDALTLKQAHDIRTHLQEPSEVTIEDETVEALSTPEPEIKQPQAIPVMKITYTRLFIAGLTSGGVGVIIMLLLALFSQLQEIIPENFYNKAFALITNSTILGIVIIVSSIFIIAWVVSIVLMVIRNGNFTVKKIDDELLITYGLIEKKHVTIPIRRIQSVRFKQNMIRQPFGFGGIYVDVAGGRNDVQDDEMGTTLFPLMKKSEVTKFFEVMLPDYVNLLDDEMIPLAERAWISYIFRAVILYVPIFIVLYIFAEPYSWIIVVVAGLNAILGYIRSIHAGYQLKDNALIVQRRQFSLERVMTPRSRVQALFKLQNPIQRSNHRANLKYSNMSGLSGRTILIRQFREEDLDLIADWYSYE